MTEAINKPMSFERLPKSLDFAALLRANLGEVAWSELDPAIAKRFAIKGVDHTLKFMGLMNWLYCSPIAKLMAGMLRKFSILPSQCQRNVGFVFQISVKDGDLLKQRQYLLAKPFLFQSLFSEIPSLHEEFSGGLGMYIELAVENGALIFRDRGYYIRMGTWRLPLPRLLTVGRFELVHQNLKADRFLVIIRIAHPLWGTLFYQRGEFYAETE